MFFGDDYFGKVDWVPGLFYVKTRFLHIWWFPLIPRESYLVLEQPDSTGFQGALPIRLRWKSVWFAWAKACLVFLILSFVSAGGLIWSSEVRESQIPRTVIATALMWGIALAFVGLYFVLWRCSAASLPRAIELGKLLGLGPEQFTIADRRKEAI